MRRAVVSRAASIRIIDDPSPVRIPASPEAFLDWLGGPAEIRLPGRDGSRARIAVGLLHGNEPSGLHAIHRWLRAGRQPAVDASLFVMAVDAARLPPGFAHRMPPGRCDLNRCYAGPPDDEVDGALAATLLARVRRRPCEALVDLHNNTGHNPAYGVLTVADPARARLASLFADIGCLLGDLRLGTLLEAIEGEIPAVSIECGQAGDADADALAAAGLRRFLEAGDLGLDQGPERPLALFEQPVRVRLRPGVRIAFGDGPVAGADVTFVEHIERHNFRAPAPDTLLGWVAPAAPWPLVAHDTGGREISRDCFAVRDGTLRWTGARDDPDGGRGGEPVPIMMTTDVQVAMSDCLCYLVRRVAA